MSQKIKLRKNLNADALFSLVRSDFKKAPAGAKLTVAFIA